ncbi:MAG: hypothetical protein WD425_07535 [Nitrospirales bacterium]
MTSRIKSTLLLLSFSFLLFGCNDGPAENAGEKVDRAVEDTTDAVKDATN